MVQDGASAVFKDAGALGPGGGGGGGGGPTRTTSLKPLGPNSRVLLKPLNPEP